MPKYKVSILIPVYNSEKYIQKCARTVFAQTLKEVEYVFVDDGSTDSGIDLLLQEIQKFPERFNDICIIRHERNRGISAARQTAFDRASGEYILAMDSDDYKKNLFPFQAKVAHINISRHIYTREVTNVHRSIGIR